LKTAQRVYEEKKPVAEERNLFTRLKVGNHQETKNSNGLRIASE
jgi:hypothetical protein